jgi:hypothetical protein
MGPVGDWAALGHAVTSRRVELGYDRRDDFATAAGIGSRTVGEIERGEEKGYRKSLIARLEKALEWPPGAAQGILDGAPAPEPGTRVVYGDPSARAIAVVSAPLNAGKSALIDAAAADDPDPLEAKLERLQHFAAGLNPDDLRRLGENVQTLIEWAHARHGVPEMTAEERERMEQVQRSTRAANRALLEWEAGRESASRDRSDA